MDTENLLMALEERIRRTLGALRHLRTENHRLTRELDQARADSIQLADRCEHWERERRTLGRRIEHLLIELDTLTHHDSEGAADDHGLADRIG